ncbi:exportin ellipsoid body open isoform X2 [Amblyomma americanum]
MAVDSLQGTVGGLVNEFFSDRTSNQRKREIECQLSELNQREGIWMQWLQIIKSQTQPELLAFAFSALQDAISGDRLDRSARSVLRADLQFMLMTAQLSGQQQPAFVRNKVVKLLVHLGFIDWPDNEPDFFNHILQLCQAAETQLLGLLMLQMVLEELSRLPECRPGARVEKLRDGVANEMSKFWPILTDLIKRGPGIGENMHQAFRCIEISLHWTFRRKVDPKLMDALCCCAAAPMVSPNSHAQAETVELAILSLGCLYEIVASEAVPLVERDCKELLQQFTMGVLQATIPPEAADSAYSSYLDKLTDFLHRAMRLLPCLNDKGNPGLHELLSLLFKRTFQEPDPERYCMCLKMWGTVLNILDPVDCEHNVGLEHRELVGVLMDQMLVRCCRATGTTAQSVLEAQLDLLHRTGKCFPEDASAKMLSILEPELSHFQSPQVTTAVERLRSFYNILQALGRITIGFSSDQVLEVGLRLCQAAARGYQLVLNADKAWAEDIADVQSALLASLQHLTYSMPMGQFPSELLLETALVPVLEPYPEKVCRAGCSLLRHVCRDIRPCDVLSLQSMQRLCDHLCQGTMRPLSPECEEMVVQSVHAALCLQWCGRPSAVQCWDQRAVVEANLLNAVAQPLLQREPPGPAVERSLSLLRAMLEVLWQAESQGKQMAAAGLAPLWPLLLERLPPSLQGGSDDPVLGLLECAVRILTTQLGADKVERLLVMVEQRVSQDHEEGKVAGMEWLMAVLHSVVRERSLTKFVPVVIRLCLDQIQPRLVQCSGLTPVLGPRLLDLLARSVAYHWRYFFPGGVVAPEQLSNPHEFGRILSVFGWFLHLPEPDIVRQSVNSLLLFNVRHRVFQKAAFREGMLAQFVEAALRCLVSSPVRDLLKDEFQSLLFALAEVDFKDFYGRLLPSLVPPEELNSLKWENDSFGFRREMECLVSNLRRATG